MKPGDLLYKLLMGIVGASVSVNAWLLTSRITDMTDSIKKLNDSISIMQREQAALGRDVEHSTDRFTRVEMRLDRLERNYRGR